MRSSRWLSERFRSVGAFLAAAAIIGACNDITAPDEDSQPAQSSAVSAAETTPPTVAVLTPANGATGVATNVRVVIQFNETMDLSTINSSTFTVAPSGGQPVSGVILFHGLNRVSFDPSPPLGNNVTYTIRVSTGAKDISGNAVASDFTSTFSTVISAADATPPTVVGSSPVNGANNVSVSSSVTATFSETMDASTIGTSSVSLAPSSGGPPIAANVTFDVPSKVVTLAPTSALAFGTPYTLTISTAVKDLSGNAMAATFTAAFTTAAAPDVTSPTVTNVTPANSATGVGVGSSVVVTFSEAMTAGTIGASTFTLTPTSGGSPVAASVTYSAGPRTATLVPSSPLAGNTGYTVNVTSGATDLANNGLVPFSSTFTTAAPSGDVTPPTVAVLTPANGATGQAVNLRLVIQFSETMNLNTINSSTFTVTPAGGSPIPGVILTHGLNIVSFDPSPVMAGGTTYTIRVTTGAKDVAGNGLASDATSTFTTVGAADNTPPTVTAVAPVNGATSVALGASATVTFSEPMNAGSVNGTTFTLTPAGGSPIAATVSYNGGAGTATLVPSAALTGSTTYTVNVTNGAKDAANNGLTPFSSTFTTIAADVTAPTVTNVTPANSATGVVVGSGVVVTFSEPMAAGTIGASTFTLTPTSGGSPVAANVTYNGGAGTATLAPSSALAGNTSYTVNVTSGAKDLANNGLVPFSSSFTTAAPTGDVTPPTVVILTPANGATGQATNKQIVIQFSETMNLSTINGTTFTVSPPGGGAIPGVINFHGLNRVSFDASPVMAGGVTYTVRVTTEAKDLAGNGVASDFTSTFTTVAPADVTPPTVTSVAPTNGATGVAIASNVVVTFSEAMNAGTVTGSTFTLTPTSGGSPVTASVSYNAGSATLDPSSDLAYGTSYTVNVTNGAKDLANNGLTPFSSTFTTLAAPDLTSPAVTNVTPVNAGSGVAIGTNVAVTFSEAMNAGTVNGTTFTLTPTSGGSPVAASVSYNAGSATLDPISDLAYSTSYTVNVTSGAKDLANNGLTPFSSTFTTAAAPDLTPPTVTNVTPVNSATGVAIGTNVVVAFSEAMNAGTVTGTTFTLTPTSGGSPVAASVSYNAGSATLDPTTDLAYSTSYTVNVTSGAKDLANNGLTPFSSTFTTAAAPDLTPPTVTNVTPTNAATGVAIGTNVVVTFSEAMNAGTVTGTTFTLTPTSGGSPVAAAVSYDAGSAILNPTSDLAYGASYTVNVTNGAKDLANNGLTPFSSTFTTAAPPDVTSPTITNVSPTNNATNVAIATTVVVTFSEGMNAGTVNGTTFTLSPTAGGGAVAASVSYNAGAGTATLTPSASLAYSTGYTVNVTNGAKDLANNGLTAFSSTFTTLPPPDVTPPTVTGVTPINGATGIAANSDVVVTFSEAMSSGTLTTSTFTLTPTAGGSPVAAVVSYSAGSATLNPSSNLALGTSYTVNVTSGAKDLANNGLTPFSSTFTTVPPDLTAPTVTAISPVTRSFGVSTTTQVRFTFSEPLDPSTISPATFIIMEEPLVAPSGVVSGTRSYEAATNTIVFTAAAPYFNHRSYTVTATTGIRDVAGNALAAPVKSCFTPPPGVGTVISMNGFWSANEGCQDIHFHLPIIQTGNTLSLGVCNPEIYCEVSAITQAGQTYLGGETCAPSPIGPPRICDVTVVSLNGTVSGSAINFTITMENGLTFTFNGSFSATGTANPFITGSISGATLPLVGMTFEREAQ